jgi:phosphatidylinositol alpha-mannosyltransferase
MPCPSLLYCRVIFKEIRSFTANRARNRRAAMRICQVSPYDFAVNGGVNKHITYLADGLRALGDEVEIIGPHSGGPQKVDHFTGFGGVVSIQANGSDNRLSIFTNPLAVWRYLRSRDFDVIHIHEPLTPMLPYYALWTAGAAARVATFHRYTEHEGWATRVARRLLTPVLRSFHRGIAVSEAARRYAGVAWNRPLGIVPNGVDTQYFAPGSSAFDTDHKSKLKMLFVGQWTDARKGLTVLLEAYRALRARGVDVSLEVCGQGDRRVPAPLIDGVTFHGRVSESELRRQLRACDVLVAPSTGQESFGIVLLEGMAVGKPVVCSDIEGYRQVASPEGALLPPPLDAAALAVALHQLAQDPARRRAMGQFNRQESLRYDWNILAAQLRSEYQAALGARPIRGALPSWQQAGAVAQDEEALAERAVSGGSRR